MYFKLLGSTFLSHPLRIYLHLYLLILVLQDFLVGPGPPCPPWSRPVPRQADEQIVTLTFVFFFFRDEIAREAVNQHLTFGPGFPDSPTLPWQITMKQNKHLTMAFSMKATGVGGLRLTLSPFSPFGPCCPGIPNPGLPCTLNKHSYCLPFNWRCTILQKHEPTECIPQSVSHH